MEMRDPLVSIRWIANVESALLAKFCQTVAKVRFASCLLIDGAMDWWHDFVRDVEPYALKSMMWEDFVTRFKREFVPTIEVQQLAREYLTFKRTVEMVVEITSKFRREIETECVCCFAYNIITPVFHIG